ncbi:hypothetical protein KY289_023940 [Solanum tuberosum]|nr:hypothetical protein KY289_023940 [Solanum tuberosum]
MKPGEKEVNTLLRNEVAHLKGEERSFVFVFLQTPIRSRSPLLTGYRLISLPLATKMFQFAKFEKSKESRLAMTYRVKRERLPAMGGKRSG